MTVSFPDDRVIHLFPQSIHIGYSDEGASGGVNEVQTITTTGTPAGGDFTLTFAGATTEAIAYNAAAATVELALEALGTVGSGNATCSGGPLPSGVVVTFTGDLAGVNVPPITGTASFTGGTSPALVITQTTAGVNPRTKTFIEMDANTAGIDEQRTTITTQGTLVTHEKDIVDVMRINFNNQVWQGALNAMMLGAATTAGLPADEASRTGYDGSYDSRNYEIRVLLTGTDLDSGADVSYRVTFWKVQPKNYSPFTGLTAKQVNNQTTTFTAAQALVDVVKNPIIGLRNTTSGDYYSVAKLT